MEGSGQRLEELERRLADAERTLEGVKACPDFVVGDASMRMRPPGWAAAPVLKKSDENAWKLQGNGERLYISAGRVFIAVIDDRERGDYGDGYIPTLNGGSLEDEEPPYFAGGDVGENRVILQYSTCGDLDELGSNALITLRAAGDAGPELGDHQREVQLGIVDWDGDEFTLVEQTIKAGSDIFDHYHKPCSSSSSSDLSSSSSMPSSSSGSSSGYSSSGSAGSGSSKSTCIVPCTFHEQGHTALFLPEMPREGVFLDAMMVELTGRVTRTKLDPEFCEVCEPGTFHCVGVSAAKPVALGVKVGGQGALEIRRPWFSRVSRAWVLIYAIRKGFGDREACSPFLRRRLPARDGEQFEACEQFINSAYPHKE